MLAFFNKYFVIKSKDWDIGNYWAFLGAAVSYNSLPHIGLNMMALWSLGIMLCHVPVPPLQVVALIAGSAISSSLGLVFYAKQRQGEMTDGQEYKRGGLGASGVASAFSLVAAMFYPMQLVTMMGIGPPMPLFVFVGAWNALDFVMMQQRNFESPFGHAAHLGGALFGVLYYFLRLRRFGGII